MNIRKIFGHPTKSQQALIDADVQNIMNKCDVIATSEFKDLKMAQESHDGCCPNCRARKEDIVNKIRQVQGKGEVHGSFSFGFGDVSGSMNVDTNEINHCNKCGNEWKKFKIKYISKTDIVRVALNYLAEIISDPAINNKSWKTDAIKVFDGCSAESITQIIKSIKDIRMSTESTLTTRCLRRYFKSVYDGENKKKLEIL